MDRRSFLSLGAFFFVPNILLPKKLDLFNGRRLFGWIPGNNSTKPTLYESGNLKSFGASKVACLWNAWTKVTKGPWIPHFQLGPDCVAHATGSGMDILNCCLIALQGKRFKYVSDSSTDMIYSGARNNIHGGYRGPGAMGDWAVQYLKKYGNLLRINYPPYNLTPYSRETLNHWDRQGIPKSLLEEAKKHPLLEYAKVTNWEEARDAIAGGKPVLFCSLQMGADNEQRDQDGFITPSGSWPHAWLLAGMQDGTRSGGCLINSHGAAFGRGPKGYDQPDGSVWVDAKYLDKYIRNSGDCFAMSNYQGFDKPEEDYIIW